MSRRYALLDVFTDTALNGNPLAVVLDAEELSDEAMQSIAKEFNLSETVFVLPTKKPAHTAKMRIFTPTTELPFAGHPTVGTSVLLGLEKFPSSSVRDSLIILEQEIGSIRAGVNLDENNARAEFDIPKLPETPAAFGDKDLIASSLMLDPREIGFENHRISMASAGVPFIMVPVRDLDVLGRCRVSERHRVEAFGDHEIYVYTRETMSEANDFHARMFAPSMGIPEDAATGSAAASFSGVIMAFDDPRDGTHNYRIEQGHFMGRPSLIELELVIKARELSAVRIGGHAVVVARGELIL
jgi:trans-2,3-dihydro-3-hydroxyanthranilate isomerase